MKRSEINSIIESAIDFFDANSFKLPVWGYWTLDDWQDHRKTGGNISEIIENHLGWDITDYGGGDFSAKGLVLFTIRNGNSERDKKPYAEKIMIVGEMQECPMHFHWSKMEDIINRGGGNLVIDLYDSMKDESFSLKPITVRIDGIERIVEAGGSVTLYPGESICLTPGMYHRFYGEKGFGRVLTGEVSMVNDDFSDNRFFEPQGRFPEIDEDELPKYLLVNDYLKFLKK